MLIFIRRVINFALKDFWRNLGLSLMTITVLVMTLVSFNMVLAVGALTQTALAAVQERVDISLLFKPEAPAEKIVEIRSTLEKMPAVALLTFKDKEKVLAEFKTKHANDKEILSALAELGGNPFGAALVVQAKSAKDYEDILKVINITEYNNLIEEKTFEDHAAIIKRIGFITSRIQQFASAISIILTMVAFLIIFNVIRVSIYTHGEEIGIMKLVGAGNWFVRTPYLLEGLIYSLLAVLISTLLLYFGLHFSNDYVKQFFAGTGFSLTGYFNKNFLLIFGGEFLALTVLSVLSASLAIRRYLKV